MSLSDFLEKYNNLVVGDENVGYYQLINSTNDEIWGTFPNPGQESEIMSAISELAIQLASGTYALRLQAIGAKSRTILAQFSSTVEGRNNVAKKVAQEHVSHAKALAMNVHTAEQQLNSMTVRMQAADQRAHEAEERAGNLVEHVYKLGDIVNNILYDQEERRMAREESEARIAIYKDVASTLMPILAPLVVIASKWVEKKINEAGINPDFNGVNRNGSTQSSREN